MKLREALQECRANFERILKLNWTERQTGVAQIIAQASVPRIDAALAEPVADEPVCRTDGRCQYAIDSGAEGLGHCPKGKCCMPAVAPDAVIAQCMLAVDDPLLWGRLGENNGDMARKFARAVIDADRAQRVVDLATPSGGQEAGPEEERIEASYWRFDARRNGYGEWKHAPMSERDAFKAEMRNALGAEKVRAEMRLVGRGWGPVSDADRAQRVPLTDAEIQAAFDSVDMRYPRGEETRNAFARAIERAHGIGAKP